MQTKASQEGEAAEAAMDSMDDRSHCILPPSGMVYCACSWHRDAYHMVKNKHYLIVT